MDGGRGFFSAADSTLDGASRAGDGLRNQRLRVDTRLRQKSAAPQDFFASLGVDTTSQDRTTSSSSSARSTSATTTRPASVAGNGATSLASGWRPPPIGGLGSQRAAPPSPSPSALGSLSVSTSNRGSAMRSTTFTSSSTSTISMTSGGSTVTRVTPARTTALPSASAVGVKSSAGPTQLFSMDDAEELFSDDEWQCDLPPVVLLDPTDETEVEPTATAAAAVADDHVTQCDDDDALASSVATSMERHSGVDEMHAAGRFDTTFGSSVDQVAPASTPNGSGTDKVSRAHNPSSEIKSPYQGAQTDVATLPPRALKSASSFSTEGPQSTFDAKRHSGTQQPALAQTHAVYAQPLPPAPPVSTTPSGLESSSYTGPPRTSAFAEPSASHEPCQQDEQWDDGWKSLQKEDGSRPVVATSSSPVRMTAALTATTVRTGTHVTPPVELTSPGGAAGEFWGDGDEDELFAQDDHVDEEWNGSIEDHSNAQVNSASRSCDNMSRMDLTAPTSPDGSLSRQPQPSSSGPASDARSTQERLLPKHTEQNDVSSQMAESLPDITQSPAIPYLFESDSATSVDAERSTVATQSVERSQVAESTPSPRPERSQFSGAIAGSASQGNDVNVFPEAPRSARFLHTPTGTGGPFGRVPSPQSNGSSTFLNELSGNVARMTAHDSTTFAAEGKADNSDSHTESSVRWDSHSGGHDRLYSGEHTHEDDDRSRRNIHNRQSDEEERDSVVSFSGEKSYFMSTGRPSSLYGGSQSSFASHRMYQSSIASTDRDGSSIASFGVSSAGATFGGSERVSEGGAYSDGAISESASMVNSSNASTAFGTDFPSASEGQFSAPGTTIGGSDNASDGGFSDGNASETTSVCESVRTNSRFETEFSGSNGDYTSVGAVEHRGMPGSFGPSAPESESVTTFGGVVPTAAASMSGGNDASAGTDPFASPPRAFSSSERTTNVPLTTTYGDSRFGHRPEGVVQKESIQSAASLFGTTAGADVPNPFGSFGPPSAVAVSTPIEEHELPTSDAVDLFGAAPSSSGYQSSFAQPTQNLHDSAPSQSYDQTYDKAGNGAHPDTETQTSAADFVQSPFSSVDTHDRGVSVSPFDTQRFVDQNRIDPFASRSVQHRYNSSATSAESLFSCSGGDYEHSSSFDRGVSLRFGGDAQTPANAAYSQPARNATTVAGQFGQQSNAPSTSHSGDQSYDHFTATYSNQASVGAPKHENQLAVDESARTLANTIDARPNAPSDGVAVAESATAYSEGFGQPGYQSSMDRNTDHFEGSGVGGQVHTSRSTPENAHSQKPAVATFASASRPTISRGSQQVGLSRTPGTSISYSPRPAAETLSSASPARSSHAGHWDNRYAHNDSDAALGLAGDFGDYTRPTSSASTYAFFGHSSADPSSVSNAGDDRARTPSSGSTQQQSLVHTRIQESFVRSGSNAPLLAEPQHSRFPMHSAALRPPMQLRDVDTSYGSVEDASLSRHGSSASLSRYEGEASFHPQQKTSDESTPASVDARSYARGAPSVTSTEAASLRIDSRVSQASSDQQTPFSQSSTFNEYGTRAMHEFARPQQDLVQLRGCSQPSEQEFDRAYPAATTVPFPALAVQATARVGADLMTNMASPVTKEDVKYSQPLDARSDWSSHSFGGEVSSTVAPSSLASQTTPPMPSPFEHNKYGQTSGKQHDHIRHSAASSSHSSHGEMGGHAFGETPAGSYFKSRVPEAGTATSHSHVQQQYQAHQQQLPDLRHVVAGYDTQGRVMQTQPHGTGYDAASQHEYGNAIGNDVYQQATSAAPTAAVKTSNKYKDPCVAPPSCLVAFGFGGNMVTMFPKRKLRLNVAGSSFCGSPRGGPMASELDNGGDSKRCMGPVNLYRMNQLHPKDVEVEQMDRFPGPLTGDVPVEDILRCLDDRLKRNRAPTDAVEAGDEDDRVLLGVLRVLIKCNGKLRSEPGSLNLGAPDKPEAQLIALLSESSERRNGFKHPSFPAPQGAHLKTHPDVTLKHTNALRKLLLTGDRKSAVSSAMTAHLWPEAMLIASFIDKEMYKQVLRTYLDEHYAAGDPCRALFLAFADQQEKSVQEPRPLLQTNVQQSTESLILTNWVSHAQVLLSNRTADTNKILTELGDRLWSEANAVAAAHICYLLASIPLGAPTPSSKMALLGGDHRSPAEARFYVSPGTLQCTEIYEWAQKQAKGASANVMVPFQGYKIIYAMLLADHGKLDTAFKYVTSMLTVIKGMTATMKPGTSVYLEGMKNQLIVLDDRLRQHLGQGRVASVAASISRSGGSKQAGKWGLGSALSMMGKIVNRVVEGPESDIAPAAVASASTSGGVFVNGASSPVASYPSVPSVNDVSSSPTSLHPQPSAQPNRPQGSYGSAAPAGMYGHATPPVSQNSAPGSSNGYTRAYAAPCSAEPSSRSGVAPLSGNGNFASTSGLPIGNEQQQRSASGSLSKTENYGNSGPLSNKGQGPPTHGMAPLVYSQHSREPSGDVHSTRSSDNLDRANPACPPLRQQPPFAQKSQQGSPAHLALQNPSALNTSDDTCPSSQPKTFAADLTAPVPFTDAATMNGPASDKGKADPMSDATKKPGRFKTPPHSNSGKGSGWLSGLSSFIATKINPEAKVAKLGEQMEAYFDEDAKRWVFPGETAPEEAAMPSAPPTAPRLGSAPGSSAAGLPPTGTASAPGSISSGPAPNDPLAALMAPPPARVLMKKDPLAAMMAPPARPGIYGMHRSASMTQRKPARPQFAVFKPTAAAPDKPSG
ncbi:unnamed protein product [Hyaloperonospora brassicae]|uniref:Protein transport protein sec16 n=1 Tax=Hyaloperonospora brassicae TaxID=162125 RepID=A0AAV0U1T7_HYABA|nr:unnamed protein product [Hyaloperonospora brassicae]